VPDMQAPIHSAVLPMLLSGPPPPLPLQEGLPEFDHVIQECKDQPAAGQLPVTAPIASLDWIVQAVNAPLLMTGLGRSALTQWLRLVHVAMGGGVVAAPHQDDRRFTHPSWQQRPFNLFAQAVLLGEQWCAAAAHDPGEAPPRPGSSSHHPAAPPRMGACKPDSCHALSMTVGASTAGTVILAGGGPGQRPPMQRCQRDGQEPGWPLSGSQAQDGCGCDASVPGRVCWNGASGTRRTSPAPDASLFRRGGAASQCRVLQAPGP